MAGALGAVSGVASVVGGLFGKSSADKVQLPPNFYAPYLSDAASGAYGAISNFANNPAASYGNETFPQAQGIANNYLNTPTTQPAIQGAETAMQMGQQGAQTQYGYGQGMSGYGASLLPYATQIVNMGLDPQNEMYNRNLHNQTEQTRASLAARGLNTSPYGAGVENKSLSDFNIDWANTALQRAQAGATGGAALANTGGNFITQGQALAAQAPGSYYTASMYPYQTATGIANNQFGALNSAQGVAQGGQQLAQSPIDAYLKFLQGGQSAATSQGNQQLAQANLGFNQNQTLGSNVGTGLQQLGKADWSWMKNLGGVTG